MVKKYLTKRNIVLAGILVVFVIAVIINVNTNKSEETGSVQENYDDVSTATVLSSTDYYTAFRDNRDSVREKEIEYLETIISAENTDAETVQEANAQKLDIVACMETELVVESAIKAKGFADAAVTFHKGSVNVIVDAEELDSKQVAQILDIVMRETGEPAENIKVSVQR